MSTVSHGSTVGIHEHACTLCSMHTTQQASPSPSLLTNQLSRILHQTHALAVGCPTGAGAYRSLLKPPYDHVVLQFTRWQTHTRVTRTFPLFFSKIKPSTIKAPTSEKSRKIATRKQNTSQQHTEQHLCEEEAVSVIAGRRHPLTTIAIHRTNPPPTVISPN